MSTISAPLLKVTLLNGESEELKLGIGSGVAWTTSNTNGIAQTPFPVDVRSLRWETFVGDSLACLMLLVGLGK